MTIELGLVGSLLTLALFFCGLLLANKVTSFGANPSALAVISTLTFLSA